MDNIIDTILNADTNVVYFCNAGKDRTGVVTAIILSNLGYENNYYDSRGNRSTCTV